MKFAFPVLAAAVLNGRAVAVTREYDEIRSADFQRRLQTCPSFPDTELCTSGGDRWDCDNVPRAGCGECVSSTDNGDGRTKTVRVDFGFCKQAGCKEFSDPISWACCVGTSNNSPCTLGTNTCTTTDEGLTGRNAGGPSTTFYSKCDGAEEVEWVVDSSASAITINTHDGQAEGDQANICKGNSLLQAGCSGATSGHCTFELDLSTCPTPTPPGPTPTPPGPTPTPPGPTPTPPTPPTDCILGNDGNMAYGSTSVDFASADPTKDITVTFTASSLNANPDNEGFVAVVFAADQNGCKYDTVLGVSPGPPSPDLTYSGGVATVPANPLLDDVSLSSVGDTYTIMFDVQDDLDQFPLGFTETDDGTAQLYLCVELQQHACDVKQEFKGVWLDIEMDMQTEFEGILAELRKEVPAREDINDVQLPSLTCELVNYDGPGTVPGSNVPTYTQGDAIEVCCYIPVDSTDALCMKEVVSLEALLSTDIVDFLDTASGNLLMSNNNGFTQVVGTFADPVCVGGDRAMKPPAIPPPGTQKCCRAFIPDQRYIQALTDADTNEDDLSDQSVQLTIRSTIEWTYDCDGVQRRVLQIGDAGTLSSTDEYELRLVAQEVDGCDALFLICWFQAFIASILSLFGL